MKTISEIDKHEIVDLLNKNWMTHDGMWFYHCVQSLGIKAANRLNRAVIDTLAPLEIARLKKALGFTGERIESFEALKEFFKGATSLMVSDFMGGDFRFEADGTFHIEMKPGQCFAYKGMKRIGVVEEYQCGVIHRIECWIRALGVDYEISPPTGRCRMHHAGGCKSVMTFRF